MRCDMKRKILLLGLVLVGMTGCSVNYDVSIDSNFIEEMIEINANINDESELEYYENSKQNEFITYYDGEDHYYQTNFNDNYYRTSLSYTYDDVIPYSLSSAFHDCFSSSSIVTNGNRITIRATGFVCYNYNYTNLESLNVNVRISDYDVVSNNASRINDNIYIWSMQNGQFPNIELVLEEKEETQEPVEDSCNITCGENEELVNPNSSRCYCREITSDIDHDDSSSLLDYILVGSVVLLFVIAIIGLVKYKSAK